MVSATETPVWAPSLIDRILAGDFVLFIGSGFSSNARNNLGESPPTWSALLTSLSTRFVGSAGRAHADVRRLLRAHDYLGAAELLAEHCEERGLSVDFRRAIVTMVDGANGHRFEGSDLHSLVGELNPPIIVTTNYDRILERSFPSGYAVRSFSDSGIASHVRTGEPLLLKLHGTYDAPESTVLTRSDFTRLRREGAHALETLSALFLTKTVLFVGYSLDDPDLRLILENLFGVQQQYAGHYLLGSNKTSPLQRSTLHSLYGVNLVAFGGSPAVGAKRSMEALVASVEDQRKVLT